MSYDAEHRIVNINNSYEMFAHDAFGNRVEESARRQGFSLYQEAIDGSGIWRTSNDWSQMDSNSWTLKGMDMSAIKAAERMNPA